MTTRQHMAWAQVSHLWGNGGTVEGEVSCASLSEEEKKKTCHESDATWNLDASWEVRTPNSLTQSPLPNMGLLNQESNSAQVAFAFPCLLQPWSNNNDG